MNLNFLDSDNIDVNNHLLIKVDRIGPDENHPIFTIDNVFKDPDKLISDIIEKIPLDVSAKLIIDNEATAFPGVQTPIYLKFSQINNLVTYCINEQTDFDVDHPSSLDFKYQLNVLKSNDTCEWRSIQPHVDPAMFAFVIYLNPEEECKGGTSFFEHSDCGVYNMEHVDMKFKRQDAYWNYKEWEFNNIEKSKQTVEMDRSHIDPSWKEIHHIPMKYNRMVLYPSYLWHTAVYNKEDYSEFPRVSIAGFIARDYFI